MEMNNRKLIDYLPPFMQEYQEMRHIMKTEQSEIEALWAACDDAINDQFVQTATENGVKRWEDIYGITPKDTDTLDERKFRLLTRISQELPYTTKKLAKTLSTICGIKNYSLTTDWHNHHIGVKLALTNQNNYQEVVELLKKMLPANQTYDVQIMFNTHTVLKQFTHAELSAYTHEELRSKVFENNTSGVAILENAKLDSTVLG